MYQSLDQEIPNPRNDVLTGKYDQDDQDDQRKDLDDGERRQHRNSDSKSQPNVSCGPPLEATKHQLPQAIRRSSPRLGLPLKASMAASLAALIAAVIFLSWLWWADDNDPHWHRWVLTSNRLQLSIAITSVIIRAAIGTLSASAVAMIASLAVERRGVRLHAVAQVSITRFASSGSISFALLALRDSLSEPLMRILLICNVLTTLGTQFTSTLLLADLSQSQIISTHRQITSAYRMAPSGGAPYGGRTYDDATRNYLQQKPQVSETFAEYAEESALEADGLDDTGLTVRAFLPLGSQEEREALREFQGKTRVINSRVACARPIITDVRMCSWSVDSSVVGGEIAGICGNIQIDTPITNETTDVDPNTETTKKFSCPLPAGGIPPNGSVWQTCQNSYNWTTVDRSLGTGNLFPGDPASETLILWDAGQFVKPLLELVRPPTQSAPPPVPITARSDFEGRYNGTLRPIKFEHTGPWLQQTFRWSESFGNNGTDVNLKMTACILHVPQPRSTPTKYDHMKIVASRPQVMKEPTYRLAMGRWMYDTADVRRQLGAGTNHTQRGNRQVLAITAEDMKKSISDASHATTTTGDLNEVLWFLMNSGRSKVVEFYPTGPYASVGNQVDPIYVDLLSTIINETNSPARALQAVRFMEARMAYHDMLPFFTPEENETTIIRTMQTTSLPTRRRGYWAVMGILGAFHILFAVICTLFSATNFSLPDNIWHTIAQISANAEISRILSRAKVMTDSEAKATSEEQHGDDEDRFVVRNGVFVRASVFSAATTEDPEKSPTAGQLRRRFIGRGSDE